MAERIVKKVAYPNLLADPAVKWQFSFDTDRRRSIPGRETFPISDLSMLRALGVPQLRPDEGFHLLVFGTGGYSLHRADVAITATREVELRNERQINYFSVVKPTIFDFSG